MQPLLHHAAGHDRADVSTLHPPLRHGEISIPFAGELEPMLVDSEGCQRPLFDRVSLDASLEAFPFRSVIATQWPTTIGLVVALVDRDSLPLPLSTMTEIFLAAERGHAILLATADSALRDRAKAAITALLMPEVGA